MKWYGKILYPLSQSPHIVHCHNDFGHPSRWSLLDPFRGEDDGESMCQEYVLSYLDIDYEEILPKGIRTVLKLERSYSYTATIR